MDIKFPISWVKWSTYQITRPFLEPPMFCLFLRSFKLVWKFSLLCITINYHEGVLIFQQTKIFHLNYLLEPFNQNAHGNSFETFAMHYSRENPERFKTRPTIQLVNSPQWEKRIKVGTIWKCTLNCGGISLMYQRSARGQSWLHWTSLIY